MTLVLKLMKSKFAAAGAVLIIALIIILMAPRVGIYPPYNYLLGAFVLLCWLVWLVYKKLQAKKNASALEGFLNQQADDQLLTARPDVKDEIAALKEKMEHAVKILKQSKLGKGRRGSDALYVLPWYMLIGPSACGKSTAIRNSGLSFPPIDPDSEDPGKVKGLGGTRNCDWWFTNEGIILDTAGRYTISVDSAEDREEWSAFLGLLKKFRKKSPLNGLLAMVSVDELLQQSEDGIEAHAKNIRRRIDELIVKLEIIFPVYLVFTKCDLFSGFVEFFGDLSKREREQVWGYTCKYDPERTTPAHEEFQREFERLFEALKARRMRKLQGDLRPGDEKKVFLFPLEFDAARRKLTAFIETLFQPNPFQQNPALRGVYFTSGTQEGTPIGQVMGSMAQEFNIPEDIGMMLEPPKEPKAYFIKDLFSEVIIPDQAAVRPTAGSSKRRKWVRVALAAGVTVATILLLAALGFSYLGNTNLLGKTERKAKTIKEVRVDRAMTRIDDLAELEELLNHLRELDKYKAGSPPLKLRWGLYKGETVNRAARHALLARITPLLMQPTVRRFEEYLAVNTPAEDDVEQSDRYYDVGRLYVELTKPLDSAALDIEGLVEQAISVWTIDKDDEWIYGFEDLAEPQMRYWWKHRMELAAEGVVLPKNDAVFGQVKHMIRTNMTPERFYSDIIREANSNSDGFTVDDAVSGTVLQGNVSVKGAYTKLGWEGQVEGLIQGSRERIEGDPFLRETLANIKDDIEDRLLSMYVRHYKAAWQDFFENIEISPFMDISEAIEGLGELAVEESPIIELIKGAAENSKISWKGDEIQDISKEFSGINKFLDESSEKTSRYVEILGEAIADLEDGEANLEEENCGKSYATLARGLNRKENGVKKLVSRSRSSLSRQVSDFLGRPVAAARNAAYANACHCLDEAWNKQVYTPFRDKLAGSYPFDPYGTDASISDIVQFFGSGGDFDRFEEEEAEPARDAGFSLSGRYNNALRVVKAIRGVISGSALNVQFTMTAGSPLFNNVEQATFRLGKISKKYIMGTPRDYEFVWPTSDPDCELSVIPRRGLQVDPLRERGEWALFRMIDRAEDSSNVVFWTFPGSACRAGYALSGPAADFIQARYFRKFSCPTKICGQ